MAKKAYIGAKMLGNLLFNGQFSDESIGFRGAWNPMSYDSAHVKYGPTAMKLTGKTGEFETTVSSTASIQLTPSHKYYVCIEAYQTTVSGSVDIYWPIAEPVMLSGQVLPKANQWCRISTVADRGAFSAGTYPIRFDYNNQNQAGTMWFDGAMLIDLTAAFGSGKEPTKEWCDAHIQFTAGGQVCCFDTANSAARQIKNMYIGVDGKARKVKKAYVGVNSVARLVYSLNSYGQKWVIYNGGFDSYLASLAYGNGKFIVVGLNGYAAYSTDGILWTPIEPINTGDAYTKIIYGGGKFVALNEDHAVVTSTDGITWSNAYRSTRLATAEAIAYGNGVYVLLNASTTYRGRLGISTDGLIYEDIGTIPGASARIWNNIVFGNGVFIALAGARTNEDSYCARSSDGRNWENTAPPDFKITDLAYGNGVFVATGYMSSRYDYDIMYSTDNGDTWIRIRTREYDSVEHNGFQKIVFAEDRFVALPYSSEFGSFSYYSSNGINWTKGGELPVPTTVYNWAGMACGGGQLLSVTNKGHILISE